MSEFRGKQFGVRIIKRAGCPNDAVQIISVDDDNWFDHGSEFSAGWIADLIAALTVAQKIAKVGFKP